jgi:hypothetical protein
MTHLAECVEAAERKGLRSKEGYCVENYALELAAWEDLGEVQNRLAQIRNEVVPHRSRALAELMEQGA